MENRARSEGAADEAGGFPLRRKEAGFLPTVNAVLLPIEISFSCEDFTEKSHL